MRRRGRNPAAGGAVFWGCCQEEFGPLLIPSPFPERRVPPFPHSGTTTSCTTPCRCARPAGRSPTGRTPSRRAPTSTRPTAPTRSRRCGSAPTGASMPRSARAGAVGGLGHRDGWGGPGWGGCQGPWVGLAWSPAWADTQPCALPRPQVTSMALAKALRLVAVSGPTWDQVPPFQWSASPFSGLLHMGQPDLWKFSPVKVSWD